MYAPVSPVLLYFITCIYMSLNSHFKFFTFILTHASLRIILSFEGDEVYKDRKKGDVMGYKLHEHVIMMGCICLVTLHIC